MALKKVGVFGIRQGKCINWVKNGQENICIHDVSKPYASDVFYENVLQISENVDNLSFYSQLDLIPRKILSCQI